jgi:hypothetical protein
VVVDHEGWLDVLLHLAGSGDVVQLEDFVVAVRKGGDELDQVLLVRPELLGEVYAAVDSLLSTVGDHFLGQDPAARGACTLSVDDFGLSWHPDLSISDLEERGQGAEAGVQLEQAPAVPDHQFPEHCLARDLDLVEGDLWHSLVGVDLLHLVSKIY